MAKTATRKVVRATSPSEFEDIVRQDPKIAKMMELGTVLWGEYEEAKKYRSSRQEEWLKWLRQFKGIYETNIASNFTANKSQTNIRLTRSKVKALDAKMMDLLFPVGDLNFSVDPTPVADLTPEAMADLVAQLQMLGIDANSGNPEDRKALTEAIQRVAKARAEKMGKTILDQLTECNYAAEARKTLHSGHLYGTGVIKGVEVDRVTRRAWIRDGQRFKSVIVSQNKPYIQNRPIWNLFPEPLAREKKELDYMYERHAVSARGLLDVIAADPFKDSLEAVRQYISAYPNGDIVNLEEFEEGVADVSEDDQAPVNGLYELVERWGYVRGNILRERGLIDGSKLSPEEIVKTDSTMYAGRCWLLGKMLISADLNPHQTEEVVPYHFYYFDKDESSIWGTGIPELMAHPAQNVNAIGRLLNDNAAISSGPQLEVNIDLWDGDSSVDEMVPWKVWYRRGKGTEANQPAIRPIDFENHTPELLALMNMWMEMVDEVTNLPRFAYAAPSESGVATDTVGGLSIQMGNVNISLKEPAKNWDDGVTTPLITGMYDWNMQHNDDDAIKGDLKVSARGASSLVAKEISRQQIMAFAASTLNPIDDPLVDRKVLLREAAKLMDLPAGVVKNDDQVGGAGNAMQQEMQQMAAIIEQGQQLLQQSIAESEKLKQELAREQQRGVAELSKERQNQTKTEAQIEIAANKEKAITERMVMIENMQGNVEQRLAGFTASLETAMKKLELEGEQRRAYLETKSKERIAAAAEKTKLKVAKEAAAATVKAAKLAPKPAAKPPKKGDKK